MDLEKMLRELRPLTAEEKKKKIIALRALSELARKNALADEIIERWLEHLAGKLPSDAVKAYRLFYLGDQKMSTREIGKVLHCDQKTAWRGVQHVLEAMLPLGFGLDGVFGFDDEGGDQA